MGCGPSIQSYNELKAAMEEQAQALEKNTATLKQVLGALTKNNTALITGEAKAKAAGEEKVKPQLGSPAVSSYQSKYKGKGLLTINTYEGEKVDKFVILHFNDVYNITAVNDKNGGGVARFMTLVKQHQHLNPLILFSGDCFAPSVMSTVTFGRQMPPVMNRIGIHVSMYGNHDFDFGEEAGMMLTSQTNFPWLLSNILRPKTGEPLGDALDMCIVNHAGMKVGVFGVAENWTDTMPNPPEGGTKYIDFIEHARVMVQKCRDQSVDLVVALTHSRLQNDRKLAEEVEGIDLILGGHDHLYAVEQREPHGQLIVKSGSDFQDMTIIEVHTDTDRLEKKDGHHGKLATFVTKRVRATAEVPKDPEMLSLVNELSKEVEAKFNIVMGHIAVDFDCSFEKVRKEECVVGNFLADLIRQAYKADIGYMVGGGIRSNTTYSAGPFTFKDVLSMLPFQDPCMVTKITGAQLIMCLEHGLGSYPKLDGRFPHVSGIRFVHDPSKPPGSRVAKVVIVKMDGSEEPLDKKAKYSVATRGYLVEGGDGYHTFSEGQIVVDDEQGHSLSFLLRNFFWQVDTLNRMRKASASLKKIAETKERFGLGNLSSMTAEKLKTAINDVKLAPGETPEDLVIHPKMEGRCLTVEEEKKRQSHHDPLSLTMRTIGEFTQLSERPETARVVEEEYAKSPLAKGN
uniref:5'-Nucleotidase C-terminal domain-containing protein n=1 Tax=Lotharella globosa TaxID=91324 RepID=A0A7S3YAK3_9EUKA|mmetsp:Transcript_19092/g.38595  ORF Transcript_19092/g.38595 Transcript_19092/m.38595 type:complete len:683 (-) Transcript_19092:307-2355(-)